MHNLTLRDVVNGLILAIVLALLFGGVSIIADFLDWAGYHQ